MSILRQALDIRTPEEKEDSRLCYYTKTPASSLIIETGDRVRWVLPWMHFVHGQHKRHEGHEILLLAFVSHEIEIHGQNLGILAEEAANLHLNKIFELPREYCEATAARPFIEKILVRVSDDRPREINYTVDPLKV